MPRPTALALVVLLLAAGAATAAKPSPTPTPTPAPDVMSAATFKGLELRPLGPAIASGRIGDIAVVPGRPGHWWVAVSSGGVWKTTNAGTTWTPVFDGEGSYSIGCVAVDPSNPAVVWVGSGENNSQRSVGFGDGVYRTLDGGAHWQNMGLKDSQHIGRIVVDPRDPRRVLVAAQGPLWSSGGDRGLYRTTDAGATWTRVLHVSDDTGVNEVHIDPRDPDVVYASAYQRRRHVWTLVNGGPESGIHKSTDGGDTWREVSNGLPEVDLGRIGLAVAPSRPDWVYAIVEAAEDEGGFFRSTDRGESWEKRSDHSVDSAQYYHEIVVDPSEPERVYSLETWLHVTDDGGKTFRKVGEKYKHVDNHALWVDPENSDYLLAGCDGGVYESFDRGATWAYKANLPVTQFYRVAVDGSTPFYFVYGGTQDNATLGGPSRTRASSGIANEDWFTTVGGDGFESQVDPTDPNIVYSQWQHGGLVRYDRRSGELVDVKPRERPGDEPYRWNWDSPLLISPHSPTRLYFAASRLFRSDDRGDSWQVLSEDLSRGVDRNTLPVMGRIWSVDAVARHASTSFFGNAVALTESPLVEGLLYVGTDDGLVHVLSGGRPLRTVSAFPGVPDMSYVSELEASLHHPDTVFAAFSNHKNGDFAPYLLRSTDRGASWASVAGDLPARGMVWTVAEDHVNPRLLFAGTELGLYFTVDGGAHWVELEGNLPTIAVRDLAVQRRESDLVLATFGRGFYVLDDYGPLRTVSRELLEKPALLFPVKEAQSYVETAPRSDSQGDNFYAAPNPPFGAVFTYYLADKLETRQERRRAAEKKAVEAGQPPRIPSFDELRAEDNEVEPAVLLVVRDADGNVVRRVEGSREKGFHRVAWDLRYPSSQPTELEPPEDLAPWETAPAGPRALPGSYRVSLLEVVDGVATEVAGPEEVRVTTLELATLPAEDKAAALAFAAKVARLERAVHGALELAGETEDRIAHLRRALLDTPGADARLLTELDRAAAELAAITVELAGDETRSKRWAPAPPSIADRVDEVVGSLWYSSSAPTQTMLDAYRYAGEAFGPTLGRLRLLLEHRLEPLEDAFEAAGAPWTPGRIPRWELE